MWRSAIDNLAKNDNKSTPGKDIAYQVLRPLRYILDNGDDGKEAKQARRSIGMGPIRRRFQQYCELQHPALESGRKSDS